jgi:GntR family transcriptional regulator
MEIEVEFQSGVPIYEQIVHQLRTFIEAGQLTPAEQLPTTRQLAIQLGINFNTVARAYRMLDQEGLISTQPGRGTFVLGPRSQATQKKKQTKQVEDLTRFYVRKAAHMGFSPEEIQACLERVVSEEEG